MNTKFISSTPILIVDDIVSAKNFFLDKLGFEVSFEWGQPLGYLGLHKNGVDIHLNSSSNSSREAGKSTVSILTDEVDNLYKTFVEKGIEIIIKPADRNYGLRDFSIKDIDGNIINFGCEIL